jgi:CheY-like chemotaxis protein
MNLMVVKKLLRDSGAVVDTASGGMEALRKTLTTHYDLILMDHQMPEMDGIECLHRIREQTDGLNRDSKIVCLTANVGADMERLYMQEGFDGYLEKPVRGKVLEAEIMRLVPDLTNGGQ